MQLGAHSIKAAEQRSGIARDTSSFGKLVLEARLSTSSASEPYALKQFLQFAQAQSGIGGVAGFKDVFDQLSFFALQA